MNKIAIENGLAYIVEYTSEYEVQIHGPVDPDTNEPADCRIVADVAGNSIKLIIDDNEDNTLPLRAEDGEDIKKIFKDVVDNMIDNFKSRTKFVYIKNGDEYTQIGGK